MVKVSAVHDSALDHSSDAMTIGIFTGIKELAGIPREIDIALNGAISNLVSDREITGKDGEITTIHTAGVIPTKRIVIIGLGKIDNYDSHVLRNAAGAAARYLQRIGASTAGTLLHYSAQEIIPVEQAAQVIAEGTILGLYSFDQYKSKTEDDLNRTLENVSVLEQDATQYAKCIDTISRGHIIADSTCLARDMVNQPANVMTPTEMARIATNVAKTTGLGIEVLGPDEIASHKMGAIQAVSAGTSNEPRLIVMDYAGNPDDPDNKIALIGKGITFDSGGISIKPSSGMWEMKGDMSGGASVIGAMNAISTLGPRINVLGIIPAVENMPSGTAQRPGDIITAMNGKTIEVDNTDAEGRLILADAMCYARQIKQVNRIVDIATLTGAMVVALGHVSTGVMGKSQTLVDSILAASSKTGEKIWQLPMFPEYQEQNRSNVADVKNTGGRPAGSITAAFFLSEFIGTAEWAHLDIAGTFMSDKAKGHIVKGATGVPTRTLVQLVEDIAEGS